MLIPFVDAYVDQVDEGPRRSMSTGPTIIERLDALRRRHAVPRTVRAAPDARRHAARFRIGAGRCAPVAAARLCRRAPTAASMTGPSAAAPAW